MAAPIFREVEFVPSKWQSAAEKANFANRLAEFIAAGMPQRKFSKALYRDLIQCFGFMGHYDVHGFASEHFGLPQHKAAFLEQIAAAPIYGSPHTSSCDVEAVIQRWLHNTGHLDRARAEAAVA